MWGLGVILFELLTGQRPFGGETKAEILYRILHQRDARPPRSARDPANLQRICLKCLNKPLEGSLPFGLRVDRGPRMLPQGRALAPRPAGGDRGAGRPVGQAVPALAARLAVVVACSAIIWAYRLTTGRFAPWSRITRS